VCFLAQRGKPASSVRRFPAPPRASLRGWRPRNVSLQQVPSRARSGRRWRNAVTCVADLSDSDLQTSHRRRSSVAAGTAGQPRSRQPYITRTCPAARLALEGPAPGPSVICPMSGPLAYVTDLTLCQGLRLVSGTLARGTRVDATGRVAVDGAVDHLRTTFAPVGRSQESTSSARYKYTRAKRFPPVLLRPEPLLVPARPATCGRQKFPPFPSKVSIPFFRPIWGVFERSNRRTPEGKELVSNEGAEGSPAAARARAAPPSRRS
jgi:hypothetical protein